jgi:hypothetical protein
MERKEQLCVCMLSCINSEVLSARLIKGSEHKAVGLMIQSRDASQFGS